MRKTDFIKMGLKNLARRKLRTSLTVMGVVIGTFSIVVMVSLGIAMTEGYKEQIAQMGSLTTITVNKYYYNADTGISDTKELDDNLIMDISKIPICAICSLYPSVIAIPKDTITTIEKVPITTPIIVNDVLSFRLERFFNPIFIKSVFRILSPPKN